MIYRSVTTASERVYKYKGKSAKTDCSCNMVVALTSSMAAPGWNTEADRPRYGKRSDYGPKLNFRLDGKYWCGKSRRYKCSVFHTADKLAR
jgi:hypothetical protein